MNSKSISFQIFIEENGIPRSISISQESFIIGREDYVDFPVSDPSVSREHLKISEHNGKILLIDLGSANGTSVHGQRLQAKVPTEYNQGDQIVIGKHGLSLRVELIEPGSAPKTVESIEEPSEVDEDTVSIGFANAGLAPPPVPANAGSINTIEQGISEIDSLDSADRGLVEVRKRARIEARRLIEEAKDEAARIHKNYKSQMNEERNKFKDFAKELKEQIRLEEKKMLEDAELKARSVEKAVLEEGREILSMNLDELEKIKEESIERVNALKSEIENWVGDLSYELKDELRTGQESPLHFLEELRGKLKVLLEEIKGTSEDLLLLKREKHRLHSENAEIQKQKAEAVARHEHLSREVNSLKSELENKSNSKRDEIDKLAKEISSLKVEKSSLSQAVDSLRKQGKIHEDETKFSSERLSKVLSEIESKESEYRKIERDLVDITKEMIERKTQVEQEITTQQSESLKKISEEFRDIQEQARSIRSEADDYSKRLRQDVEKFIEKQKSRAEKEASSIRDQAHRESQDLLRSTQKTSDKMRSALNKELEIEKSNFNKELHHRRQSLEKDLERRREEIEISTNRRLAEVHEEIQTLEARINTEVLAARKKAALRISRLRRSIFARKEKAETECKNLIEVANIEAEKNVTRLREEFEEYKRKQQRELALQIEEAEDKAKSLVDSADDQSRTMIRQSEEDAEAIKNSAIQYKDKLIEKIESEYLQAKEEHRLEFAEEKVRQIEELKKMTEEGLKSEEDRRKYEIEEFKTNFRVHLVQAYRKSVPEVDESKIDRLEDDIERIVDRVFNADESEFKEKMGSILKIDSHAKEQVTVFWKRAMLGGAAILTMFILMWSFPMQVKKARRGLASALTPDKSATEMFVEKTKRAREERSRLDLEMNPGYFDTYSDNILYSTNFLTVYENREVQQEWILALNDFFSKELEVGDNAVVQFVSKENGLISELKKRRLEMNNSNAEKGIEKMRQIESVFEKDIRNILKSKRNYSKYKDFQKKFFSEKL